jgi:DNA-binding transcriptional MerR regulator
MQKLFNPTPDDSPRFRSGAVARMLRMPVATLRVWERRYRVCEPTVSSSGHRLYTGADVRRLALIKQLTDAGHAIGVVARMDPQQLHEMATTHAQALIGTGKDSPPVAGHASTPETADPPPRRYDDAALADLAALSSTVACECPRHVAELVALLSNFEDYSAQCARLSPQDEALHQNLRHTAATARALFEGALDRLLAHEGLLGRK